MSILYHISNHIQGEDVTLDAALVASLERIVSAPRLHRYRHAATTDLETVTLYCWNIQLAEALMPALATLEVTLRNAVHSSLVTHTGTEYWFKSVLHRQMYDNIIDLIARLTRRQGQPPTVGKIISEITFGFWPRIFAKHYQSLWWDTSNPLLPSVIPNYPKIGRDSRGKFEERLEYFVVLRNRAMHHEAVFEGVAALNKPILPIAALHAQLLETIEWIDVDAASIVRCLDRFDEIHRDGKSHIEAKLRRQFGIQP